MLPLLLSVAGVLVIGLLCSEEVRALVQRLRQRPPQNPRVRYALYTLAALLALAAAGLILFSLWFLLTTRFSYD
jgi:hypothetical protein